MFGRLQQVAIVGASLVAVAGCHSKQAPARIDVRGRVTFAGRPIPFGKIIFSSDTKPQFTGADGWASIVEGGFDTRVGGYSTVGGTLSAEIEARGSPSDRFPDGRLLFSGYRTTVEISSNSTELMIDVPGDVGSLKPAESR